MPRKTLRNRERRMIDPSSTKKAFGTRGAEKRHVRNSRSDSEIGARTEKSIRKNKRNVRIEGFDDFDITDNYIPEDNIEDNILEDNISEE